MSITLKAPQTSKETEELERRLDALVMEREHIFESIKKEHDLKKKEKMETVADSYTSQISDLEESIRQANGMSDDNSDSLRRSVRPRQPTEKQKMIQEERAQRREIKFMAAYNKWKVKMKLIREELRQFHSESDLLYMIDDITRLSAKVTKVYEDLRQVEASPVEIRKRIDTCNAVTTDVIRLIRLRSLEEEGEFDEVKERRRIREELERSYSKSVFESVASKSTTNSRHSSHKLSHHSSCRHSCSNKSETVKSCQSTQSKAEKIMEMRADIAAKKTAIKMNSAIQAQRDAVRKSEDALKGLEDQKEVEILEAKMKSYSMDEEETDHQASQPELNDANHLVPETPQGLPVSIDLSLAKAIQESIAASRLPQSEPPVFTGDPLKFMEWQASFKALINRSSVTSTDKLHYLKQYVGGSARKVVEGTFFRTDVKAYEVAWDRLHERYGNQHILQCAFRDKLTNWPRISAKNSEDLRDYSDYLNSCLDAMEHLEGLRILNDMEENKKMVQKLPDWAISRWGRQVTMALDTRGGFPSFNEFCQFVAKEARIACNPINHFFNKAEVEGKLSQSRKENKKGVARTLATKADVTGTAGPATVSPSTSSSTKDNRKHGATPYKPLCDYCEKEGHYAANCPEFTAKTLEQKKDIVRAQHRCFGCLRKGHGSKSCRSRHTCQTCKKRHPTTLHDDNFKSFKKDTVDTTSYGSPSKKEEVSSPKATALTVVSENSKNTSAVVPVWISTTSNPDYELLTYALLDTQSDSTFIDQHISKELGAPAGDVRLQLSTMLGKNSTVHCKRVTDLRVRGYSSATYVYLPPSYTRDIPHDRSMIPTRETAMKWNHLTGIANDIPALQDCDVGLLIGYNCSRALAPRQVITGKNEEPYGIKTDLGWSIVGGPQEDQQRTSGICHRVLVKEVPSITPANALRMLESDFKDTSRENKCVSQEDVQFLQIMEQNIIVNEKGHLQMPLPFRTRPELPNNKKLAMIRLRHLQRKLDKDERYKEHYVKFMNGIIEDGDAVKAESSPKQKETWYIPHHGVYHPKKPDKLRVVFDCSARYEGTSLNEHLLTGPDLTNCLVGVLCRFRKYPIAIMCDVEKMFHRFHVAEEDRDFFRFLWWENGDTKGTPIEFKMKVHLFGAASSPGCANYGLKYLAKELEEEFKVGAPFVRRNFYVDDGITSVKTVQEAKDLVKEASDLCAKGKLRLHKFISSDRQVIESIPLTERSTVVKDLDFISDELPTERTLGIQWNVERDVFKFDDQTKEQPLSRRGILSTVASIYDPLGFIAPFVLVGKAILQEMCRNGTGWDDPLPENLHPKWNAWKTDIGNLQLIQIPRCYQPLKFGTVIKTELHHFSDASTTGYGQCSYVRLINTEGKVHCALVIGKSRVAPTKIVTIPRLELAAAVVSVKVSELLKEELEYENVEEFFWTDSKVILGYISNEARRFHTFVANRVQTIRQSTTAEQWRYVSTQNNPADHASRGLTAEELRKSNWLTGPSFLWETEIDLDTDCAPKLQIGDPEVRVTTVLLSQVTEDISDRFTRFSKWSTAVGVTARIQRLSKGIKEAKPTSVDERKHAAETLVRMAQRSVYQEEIKVLSQKPHTLPKTHKLHLLNPFVKDGLLRVGGRLRNAPTPDSVKHPVILPKNNHISDLIISHYHEKVQHMGRGQTMTELRANGYWMVGGTRYIADFIKHCVACRKARRPVEEQKMADLPEERVTPSPPFTYVGMDCFGPFFVKQGRKTLKRYGLLFTCFCSRGIHVEMLDDMTTDAFINALRCFVSIRGAVRTIRCDQGSNFVGARNELAEAMKELDEDAISTHLSRNQCDFILNAPHASHTGGIWERQIRTVRDALSSTAAMCPGRLDDSSLRTLFYEAMTLVNNRPLSMSNAGNSHDLEALTPNHLLTMKSATPLPPPGKFISQDMYLRKRWRRVQFLTEQFWHRWRREYLADITTRQKWHTQRRNLKINDIVLVKNNEQGRGEWPLAKVIETTVDDDGLVRRVHVQLGDRGRKGTDDRRSKTSILERPIQKLVLLVEGE